MTVASIFNIKWCIPPGTGDCDGFRFKSRLDTRAGVIIISTILVDQSRCNVSRGHRLSALYIEVKYVAKEDAT